MAIMTLNHPRMGARGCDGLRQGNGGHYRIAEKTAIKNKNKFCT